MTLRVLPEAEEELAEAADWYESKRVGLGIELIAVVDRAFDEILEAPLSFPAWRTDRPYRRSVLKRFPYVVFFHVDGDRSRPCEAQTGVLGGPSEPPMRLGLEQVRLAG